MVNKGKAKAEHSHIMLPGIAIKREGEAPLDSVFTGIYEPYTIDASILSVRRIHNDENRITTVIIEIKDDITDLLFFSADKNKGTYEIPTWNIKTDAVFGHIRKYPDGSYYASVFDVGKFKCMEFETNAKKRKNILEVGF
jgi:hypothetical protein